MTFRDLNPKFWVACFLNSLCSSYPDVWTLKSALLLDILIGYCQLAELTTKHWFEFVLVKRLATLANYKLILGWASEDPQKSSFQKWSQATFITIKLILSAMWFVYIVDRSGEKEEETET